MKIIGVGLEHELQEFEQKFSTHELKLFSGYSFDLEKEDTDVIFDFLIGDNPENFDFYSQFSGLKLFINSPKLSLAELGYYQQGIIENHLFGYNGLPTFINREILEVSSLADSDHELLKEICNQLGTDFQIVDDRVGMVTPRIICMIINEAFYTVQEGTASKEDIDLGMKLGTNYPKGPFEWVEEIGIENVYELLEALYEDTKEERYKICPLLKKAYLSK